ncbi:MAG: ABC transporter permease [Bdellovibrionaceae bacterium]|nr:ABC transporter permease [Pseudobdellovibrionaceae bacterium]MDW8190520.1 ABC transporter permease [Pseudobdellovibrionaceae bacterium]
MVQSYWRVVWEELKEHRAAVIGLGVVLTFIVIGLFAPIISQLFNISPYQQNPLQRYQPPWSTTELPLSERVLLVEQFMETHPEEARNINGMLHSLDPVKYQTTEENLLRWIEQSYDEMLKDLQGLPPKQQELLQRPIVSRIKTFHLLGTDELGRDVFMRLIFGTRVSLGVALLVAISSSLIGLLIGSLAGYYGGWLDHILMRITDSLLSLPLMPVLIVVSALSFEKLPILQMFSQGNWESIIKLILILVLFSWMTVAKLVRAEVLSLRERDFILAAKTMGARDFFIIMRHVFPNVMAPLLVAVTLGVGESIQFEAALSFLGLGVQQPTPSWGNMLFNAQEFITEAPLLALIPGLLILTVTISFNYIGDGLQEALNPKSFKR